jgi:hypothetical protein
MLSMNFWFFFYWISRGISSIQITIHCIQQFNDFITNQPRPLVEVTAAGVGWNCSRRSRPGKTYCVEKQTPSSPVADVTDSGISLILPSKKV